MNDRVWLQGKLVWILFVRYSCAPVRTCTHTKLACHKSPLSLPCDRVNSPPLFEHCTFTQSTATLGIATICIAMHASFAHAHHNKVTATSLSHCLLYTQPPCASELRLLLLSCANQLSASAHRFRAVLHAHICCFAFREFLLLQLLLAHEAIGASHRAIACAGGCFCWTWFSLSLHIVVICVVSLFIALLFVLPDNYAQSCSPIRSAAPLFLTSACLAGAPSSGIADSATSETANRAVKLLQVTLLSYFSHLHFRYSTSKPTAYYYNTKPTCQELIFGWSQACG